jgi:hypothetical protein
MKIRSCSSLICSTLLALLIALTGNGTTFAQAHKSQSQKAMTVDDVIALTRAGLSDDLIMAQLKQRKQVFELSADQLIQLRNAKVSDAVVKVMLNPEGGQAQSTGVVAPAQGPAAPQPVVVQSPFLAGLPLAKSSGATPAPGTTDTSNSNDPMASHDSGIYLYTSDHGGHPLMTPLERAGYQGAKTGGLFASALTSGIVKAKTRAVIPGPKAGIRVTDSPAVFYFYFDNKDAGLGKTFFGVGNLSDPNQFALINLELHKANRETIIGQFSALGSSSGSDEKSMIPFKTERVRPGLYKVTVTELNSGEYCFMASGHSMVGGPMGAYGGGATGAIDIFDFGVDNR